MISRLRAWLAGLFGDTAREDETAHSEQSEQNTEQATDADQRICAVCSTPESDAETCPLCGSTEFTTVGETPAAAAEPEQNRQQRSGETTDDAAARLSELRDETEE